MMPLQSNAIESFRKYIFADGILTPTGTNFDVTVQEQGQFGSSDASQFTLLPDPLNINNLKWKTSSVYDQTVGSKQFADSMFYDFQASVLYAYKQLNIAPSYWHMYECHPRTETPNKDIFGVDGTVTNWASITFQSGVCDEACYGNTASTGRVCRASCSKQTYGGDLLLTQGGSLTADGMKQRLVNFGPVLVFTVTEGNRLYYGWNTTGLLYLYRNQQGQLMQTQEEEITQVMNYIISYQFIDCTKDIKVDTPKEDCPCPDSADKAAYKADPRTEVDGICYVRVQPEPEPVPEPKPIVVAAGSIRTSLAVMAVVMLIPLLLMW
ncbi:MAG: hypothetical protein EZS28_005109 [Streblomastix strix]|uniref:Uncharacterized protein n=1 Tax=Streblomastix strix TaxID=222440 RepID=A0A5J4WX54_9EUKA|nr:MAG: hypothetical protein EZS28_005109 [Streblomastix strix]